MISRSKENFATRGAAGFTLIEVLIVLAITALIALASFQTLSSVMNGVEGIRGQGRRVSEVNRAWALISRDLAHFVGRPVRDEFGATESAMFGGELAGNSLTLTRGGWYNPNRQLRSRLQRVRYRLEDGALWRESYVALDRTRESEPQRARLLEGVDGFELAFLSPRIPLRDGEIDTDDWPDNWGVDASGGAVAPPRAVELRLSLEDWGEVRWLYELPARP